MTRLLATTLVAPLLAMTACSGPSREPTTTTPVLQAADPVPEGEAVAYFAGGCFWGVEHFLEKMPGVLDVESGYMGGDEANPSYEEVVRHTTGHLEAVQVRFDPGKVSYHDVAKRFFEIHDPTQEDGQGPDIGGQYLSAVFYVDDEQKQTTESLIGQLEERGFDVATTVRAAKTFWKAEGYHQDYYEKNGKTPYCHMPVSRFGD